MSSETAGFADSSVSDSWSGDCIVKKQSAIRKPVLLQSANSAQKGLVTSANARARTGIAGRIRSPARQMITDLET